MKTGASEENRDLHVLACVSEMTERIVLLACVEVTQAVGGNLGCISLD